MHFLIMLPILFPMLAGLNLLFSNPKDSRSRNLFVMASAVLTALLSLLTIFLSYRLGCDELACTVVHFSEKYSISLRVDGASMVYGTVVSVLWPLITLYALDYMTHEGSENRFFGFWLISFGVVLGIASPRIFSPSTCFMS
jgi:multicomponent Na+:H+ antiporter subunit D